MEQITANAVGRARAERLLGRDYLVVPLRMVVPGVLSGSRGPLLYPREELAKSPGDWDGMPIVLGHPQGEGGAHVSARSPQVWNASGLGFVFNARAQEALDADGYFDVEATRRLAPDLLAGLRAGRPSELSTGLRLRAEPAPEGAAHNGRPYTHVARDYRPDHLAVLLNTPGACSIADGCGVLVNEDDNEETPMTTLPAERRQAIIADLAANCRCEHNVPWKGLDAKALTAFSDDRLEAYHGWHQMLQAANAQQAPPAPTPPAAATVTMPDGSRWAWNAQVNTWTAVAASPPPAPAPQPAAPAPAQNAAPQPAQQTEPNPAARGAEVEAWAKKAFGHEMSLSQVENAIRGVMEQQARYKAERVGQLVENLAGEDREQVARVLARLDVKDVEALLPLAELARRQQQYPAHNYAGAAGPAFGVAGGQQEHLLPASRLHSYTPNGR